MAICVSEQTKKLPKAIAAVFGQENYTQFLEKLCTKSEISYVVFTFHLPAGDPLLFVNRLDPHNEFLFFNEKADRQKTIAAGGCLVEITAAGKDRFLTVHQKIETLKKETLHFNAADNNDTGFNILGGFSFFDEIESSGWKGFKSASFTLPKQTIVKNGKTTISISVKNKVGCLPQEVHQKVVNQLAAVLSDSLKITVPIVESQEITQTSPVDFSEWEGAIREVKSKINEGIFRKIVLARQLNISSKNKFDVVSALSYFRKYYPNCCSYLLRGKETGTFLGCSPERLLAFENGYYQTEALAGSMLRGKTETEDLHLQNKLLNSSKNLEEQDLVLQDIEKSLLPLARDLEKAKKPLVKKFTNVHHLFSPIRFQVKNGVSPFQVLSELHPTPALGGYPQKEAVDYLAQNCLINRGWFGSPIGWFNTSGSGEFTVAIRCGLVGEYSAKLFAGCGILETSTAEEEWQESDIKFKPMLNALKNG